MRCERERGYSGKLYIKFQESLKTPNKPSTPNDGIDELKGIIKTQTQTLKDLTASMQMLFATIQKLQKRVSELEGKE
ncbi:hypothetical protein BKH46_07410 [Helicobacter sp. 12S02634-8]|nr:hypothetical protein BKH46_07410 [Helicobacter sp. 12S02634-8]